MTDAVIDPLTLPIVARCDAREAARQEAQDRTNHTAYLTGEVSRRIHQRRLDCATLDAAVAWARGPVPDGESPEAFDLRANIVRAAT